MSPFSASPIEIMLASDDGLRIPDDLWALLSTVFPDNDGKHGERHGPTRRRYMDSFFFCLRSHQPYCLLPLTFEVRKDMLAPFMRLWTDRLAMFLEEQPTWVLEKMFAYTGMRPDGNRWIVCLRKAVGEMRLRAQEVSGEIGRVYLHMDRRIPEIVRPVPLPRPVRCPHCAAGHTNLYRPLGEDFWQCWVCGWLGFDPLSGEDKE